MKKSIKVSAFLLSFAIMISSLFTLTLSASSPKIQTKTQLFDFESEATNLGHTDNTVEWSQDVVGTQDFDLCIGDAGYVFHSTDYNAYLMEDGENHFLRIKTTASNDNIGVRTGIVLKPNTYYYVTYKYQASSVDMFTTKPAFTVSTDSNSADHMLLDGSPCYVSGTTLNSNGTSYVITNEECHNIATTIEWNTVEQIIYTASIPTESRNYLGLCFTAASGTNGNFMVDDILATEYDPTYDSSTKNITFDDPNEKYIFNEKVSKPASMSPPEIIEDGAGVNVLNFEDEWCYKTQHFNYKLQSNTTYRVTWRRCIRGNKGAKKSPNGFYAVPMKPVSGDSYANCMSIHTMENNVTTWDATLGYYPYQNETFEFTTGELTNGNEWLGFLSFPSEGFLKLKIDWIKIEVIPDNEAYIPQTVDFEENGSTYSYLVNSAENYVEETAYYEKDVQGNRYLTVDTGKTVNETTNGYTWFAFRTDILMEPNTDYSLSMKAKIGDVVPSFYVTAGKSDNNWMFFMPGYVDESDKMFRRASLIGDEQTTTVNSTEYTYRDGNLGFTKGSWQTVTATFNTGSVVTDKSKYLSIFVKCYPNEEMDRTFSFDDIVLTKTAERSTAKTILCNLGHGKGYIYRNADNAGTVKNADGYLFKGWYTDIERTVPYVYNASEVAPDMLYAGYSVDLNGDSESNVIDLIRLKKIAAGTVDECVAAADRDEDGIVNGVELSQMRKDLVQ